MSIAPSHDSLSHAYLMMSYCLPYIGYLYADHSDNRVLRVFLFSPSNVDTSMCYSLLKFLRMCIVL